MQFNYLSTEQRSARVDRGGAHRTPDPEPAGVRAVQRRRDLAGPVGRDRRGDHGLGRPRLRDRAAPVVHLRRWAPTRWRSSTRDTMRVHGVDGLRVVDASVLPIVTNGNIYAPTMMIAEKAADLILGNSRSRPTTPRSIAAATDAASEVGDRPNILLVHGRPAGGAVPAVLRRHDRDHAEHRPARRSRGRVRRRRTATARCAPRRGSR